MYNLTQALKSLASSKPSSIATMMNGRVHTWSEVLDRVSRLAQALRNLGLAEGDRVAILSLNSDRFLEYYYAVWWSGGVVVPMNTRWSVAENAYAINDSRPKILFVDREFSPVWHEIEKDIGSVENVIFCDDGRPPERMLNYEALVAESSPCADAERSRDDLAGIYYTGGTTGFPKGVMLSHMALWYNNMVNSVHINYNRGGVYLHAAPMFHLGDMGLSGASMSCGLKHVFMPKFDPSTAMDLIEKYEVSHTIFVPTMWGMVLSHPDFDVAKFKSMHTCVYGAAPMSAGLLQRLLDLFPNLNVIQGYGQTEMGPAVSNLNAEDHRQGLKGGDKLRSAGVAGPGVDIRICDEHGNDLPNGEVGELYARSPGVMLGYWNLPEQTADTLIDGWVKTGDGAYRDDDGFIFIVDRVKDMIVTGGENVFSAEVESAISTHPDVEAVAVIGIPSEKWGESVHAIVLPKTGKVLTEESIFSHTKSLIANYKQPRSVSFRSEPFPVSGVGKVLKRELRKPFWEGKERSVN